MPDANKRWPAATALVGSLLGLVFSGLSASDYAKHLDRQMHDVHCSFIPGLTAGQGAENACRAAMYSPYAAVLRDRFWGGIPIGLFAVGAFSFFAAFSLYLLLAGPRAPRRAHQFAGTFGVTPLLTSLLMAVISAVKLGQFCKTCVGIYVSSLMLAVGGIAMLLAARAPASTAPARNADGAGARREGGWLLLPTWAALLGAFSLIPAAGYATSLPDYTGQLGGCGKLEKPAAPANTLVHIAGPGAVQPATLFVDPLCPTCKALHQRLDADGLLGKLDISVVLFPLDSDCNWMLDRAVHPGSCLVTKAILCSEHRAAAVLDWAYDRQEELLATAKSSAGVAGVRAAIRGSWPGLDACIDAKDTSRRLDRMLRYIVNNHLPVSTPQLFLGDARLCDEDTDMGLAYAIRRIAPALASRGMP